jgi:hypothetical protein
METAYEAALNLFTEYPYITRTMIASHLQLLKGPPPEIHVTSISGKKLYLNNGSIMYLHSKFVNLDVTLWPGCGLWFQDAVLVQDTYMPTEKMVVILQEDTRVPKSASQMELTILDVERGLVDQHQEPYAHIHGESEGAPMNWILDASQFWLLEYLGVGDRIIIVDYFLVDGFLYTEPTSVVLIYERSQRSHSNTESSPTNALWGTVVGHVPHDELNPHFTIGLIIRSEKGTETVFFQGTQALQAARTLCGHYVFVSIKQGLLGTHIDRNRLYNISKIPSIPHSTLCPISPLTFSTEFKYVDALLVSIQSNGSALLRNLYSCRFLWTKGRTRG